MDLFFVCLFCNRTKQLKSQNGYSSASNFPSLTSSQPCVCLPVSVCLNLSLSVSLSLFLSPSLSLTPPLPPPFLFQIFSDFTAKTATVKPAHQQLFPGPILQSESWTTNPRMLSESEGAGRPLWSHPLNGEHSRFLPERPQRQELGKGVWALYWAGRSLCLSPGVPIRWGDGWGWASSHGVRHRPDQGL